MFIDGMLVPLFGISILGNDFVPLDIALPGIALGSLIPFMDP